MIEKIGKEFVRSMKLTDEEELHIIITKTLCISQFFKIDQFEKNFLGFLEKAYEKLFNDKN
jgi:hypothetical protein